MRKLLVPSLVLLGCWTATKPASTPGKPLETASTGGATYGGAAYGGAEYARLEAARSVGLLGSTALKQGGSFASLTGTGDISSGFDDTDIYGGLIGDGTGAGSAGGAQGVGSGAGGGGTGWGTIGTGRYGTIGHGSGTSTNPRGSGYGTGGGMRGRTADLPTVSIGQPTASGGDLDKAIIRRYIKRNQQKIQYCYEKELLARPKIAGTATVRFIIGLDGLVSKASGAGLPPVDACVAKVIAAIEFPKPKGAGPVAVSYPFVFSNGATAKTP